MGCAFCKNDPNQGKYEDPDDANEKTAFIPKNNHSPTKPIYDDTNYHATNSLTKTDEQSQLSRILHKTAQNIIDVSAIEPHSMERTEYMDKMRNYLDKTSKSQFNLSKSKQLAAVTHAPMNVLLAPNISQGDIKLITEATKNIAAALSQATISCSENLVEKFGEENATVTVAT